MTNKTWTSKDIPDQTGKVIIVTGANSGLGYETSLALASRGAQVIMACRNPAKAERAKQQILYKHPNSTVELRTLDLADLNSVRSFAEDFARDYQKLDILINNAGLMAIPYLKTRDGFEMQFGVNHLGHFALTGLLLRNLLSTAGSRVVSISSFMHKMGHMNFQDLNSENGYERWEAYSQSKLANLLFCYELDRKLRAYNAETISVIAHPGYSNTHLQFVAAEMEGARLKAAIVNLGNRWLAQNAAMGALPTLYAATVSHVQGGEFFGPSGLLEIRGYPVKVESNQRSHSRDDALRLWEVSEQLTSVTYDFTT